MNPQNKKVIYTNNYGVPVTHNPNQMVNENQRHTMKNPNAQKMIQNPQQHKMYLNNPNPNAYTYNNIPQAGNNRRTYNPAQLKANPNNQIFENEIVEETYTIDPKTGQKYILQTNPKNKTHQNNNQIYNQQVNKNQYPIDFKTGNKIPQYKLEDNLTSSTYQDLTLTIDPTLQKDQKKRSHEINYNNEPTPILENLNQTIFSSQGIFDGEQITDVYQLNPKKSATLLTVSSLASLPYEQYPDVKFSKQCFMDICGYGFNSYNGKVKKFNEDRVKVIPQYQLKGRNNKVLNISYFAIFDGHSGNKCSDFLKENLHKYLLNSPYFPNDILRAVREAFNKAEETFKSMAYDATNNILLDKSGSCALVMIIINDVLFSINLGDSRALYSYDTGKYLYQITRDHKPNDEIERKRIENAGGKVFYANTVTRNGREIELKEEDFGKNFSFPYRISPGKIAVSFLFFNIY